MISGPKSSFSVRTASNQSSSSLLLLLPLLTDNWNMRALLRKTRFTGLSGLSVSVNSGSFFLPPSSYRLFVWRLDRNLHLGIGAAGDLKLMFCVLCSLAQSFFLPNGIVFRRRAAAAATRSGFHLLTLLLPACLPARERERQAGRQKATHTFQNWAAVCGSSREF